MSTILKKLEDEMQDTKQKYKKLLNLISDEFGNMKKEMNKLLDRRLENFKKQWNEEIDDD